MGQNWSHRTREQHITTLGRKVWETALRMALKWVLKSERLQYSTVQYISAGNAR